LIDDESGKGFNVFLFFDAFGLSDARSRKRKKLGLWQVPYAASHPHITIAWD
jgi:hypothetical protein